MSIIASATADNGYVIIDNSYYKSFQLVPASGWTIYINTMVFKGFAVMDGGSYAVNKRSIVFRPFKN